MATQTPHSTKQTNFMRNLLKHFIFHIVCFGCIFPLSAGEDSLTSPERITIQDEVIDAFHNSMGFDYLTKEESAVIDLDSILNYLESTKQYETYFELERILVNHIFSGEKFVWLLLGVSKCTLKQVRFLIR